ncbi:hypothetical protein [Streptosporangium sp. NPDC087985]|uniref:hypothetical protein n=1 Tax=Streptosporangium sp. NPDC087985 TaxID=3366196 RepID=UPI0037F9CDA0
MKCGAQIALAVGAGYFLGRHHKLRMALALAVAGATGRLGGGGPALLQKGLKLLGSSPEIEKLASSVRGELLEVGKAAMVSAASKQVDALTSKLHDRAESLRAPGRVGAGAEEEEEPTRGRRAPGGKGGRARAGREEREPEDEYYEEDYEEEEPGEYGEEEPLRGRRAPGTRGRPAARTRTAPEEYGEYEEEEEEEEEDEEPSPKSTRRRSDMQREKATAGDSPVRRARR